MASATLAAHHGPGAPVTGRPAADVATSDLSAGALRAVLDAGRTVVLLVRPDGSSTWLPGGVTRVLGYEPHAEELATPEELLHPEDRPVLRQVFRDVRDGTSENGADPVDLRMLRADGEWVVLETTVSNLVDDPAVGAAIVHGQDVTTLRAVERRLRSERSRLFTLVHTLRSGVVMLDADGRLRLANRAASELLGLGEVEPLLGQPIASVLAGRRARSTDRVLAAAKLATEGSATAREEVVLAGGVIGELDAVPLGRTGEVLGTLIHLHELADRGPAAPGVERRNRALNESAAISNEFVATASHELRGPLTSVVVFGGMLADPEHGPLTDEQRQFVNVIQRNGHRLLRLIEDVLLLSRLESRTLTLETAPARLDELVQAAVAERQPTARAAGIRLHGEVVAGPPVQCDETRIHQVVDNLLGNALKFTPPGGSVTVYSAPDGDGWLLEVSDTGIGIPAGDLGRIFGAFFRASNADSQVSGTGLGLVVSRAIVERHGGRITVNSVEGVGTTVSVWLPQRRAGDPAYDLRTREGYAE
jgi:PAS domain S-box-containing protein